MAIMDVLCFSETRCRAYRVFFLVACLSSIIWEYRWIPLIPQAVFSILNTASCLLALRVFACWCIFRWSLFLSAHLLNIIIRDSIIFQRGGYFWFQIVLLQFIAAPIFFVSFLIVYLSLFCRVCLMIISDNCSLIKR